MTSLHAELWAKYQGVLLALFVLGAFILLGFAGVVVKAIIYGQFIGGCPA